MLVTGLRSCRGMIARGFAVSQPRVQFFGGHKVAANVSAVQMRPASLVAAPRLRLDEVGRGSSMSRALMAAKASCPQLSISCAVGAGVVPQLSRGFSTTAVAKSLDEFFVSFPELDNEKNPIYPAVGRAWRTDELRQKSFDDLHKLWWILLKERNSLQIERHSSRSKGAMIINPSRIRKVRLSMNRIKVVLGERKRMLGMLKRQAEREAAEQALAAQGGPEEPPFEYPASLVAHPYLAPQKPKRGTQRKRWNKFVKHDPYHAKQTRRAPDQLPP